MSIESPETYLKIHPFFTGNPVYDPQASFIRIRLQILIGRGRSLEPSWL